VRKYARVQDGTVVELLVTEGSISKLFVPELTWVDASSVPSVAEGWCFKDGQFSEPTPPKAPGLNLPTLAELRQQLALLEVRISDIEKAG
jgi:hypothetical protein